MTRFITLDTNKKVIGTRQGNVIVEGEDQSELGEIGQTQQLDGSFIDDITPITPEVIQPTNQEISDRLTNIEDTQDLMLLKLEGVIV